MKNGKYVPKHQPGCHVDQPGVTDIGDMDWYGLIMIDMDLVLKKNGEKRQSFSIYISRNYKATNSFQLIG